jgi:fucose 4-O-acetylase-like acetyltransferase
MKKRLEYIDQIRGLAIILVVIGHIIQFNGIQGGMKSSIFGVIYSFHMPLFFFISGYIGFKTIKIIDRNSYVRHVRSKGISLLIPLFTWSILVNKFFLRQEWYIITMDDISGTIVHPGLWFLKVLFEILFLYGFFVWLSTAINKQVNFFIDLIIFSLILFLTLCYNYLIGDTLLSSLFLYSLFFYVAVFISKYAFLEKIVMSDWIFTLSFVLFFILCGQWKIDGTTYDDLLKIVISCFSFVLFLNFTIRYNWNHYVSKQLMIFGQYSLAIYVMQFHLTHFIVSGDFLLFDNLNPILLFFITTAISIPICYISVLIAKLIELNGILNFIFLGKKMINKSLSNN